MRIQIGKGVERKRALCLESYNESIVASWEKPIELIRTLYSYMVACIASIPFHYFGG